MSYFSSGVYFNKSGRENYVVWYFCSESNLPTIATTSRLVVSILCFSFPAGRHGVHFRRIRLGCRRRQLRHRPRRGLHRQSRECFNDLLSRPVASLIALTGRRAAISWTFPSNFNVTRLEELSGRGVSIHGAGSNLGAAVNLGQIFKDISLTLETSDFEKSYASR